MEEKNSEKKERKMRDSGIPWIGEVPEGWGFPKITHILDYTHPYPIGDGDHGSIKATDYAEYGIPFIRVQNLGFATDLCLDNVVYISEAQNRTIQNSTLKPNDILFAKTGATIGKVGIVPESIKKANTTSHVGKITVSESIIPKYIFYVLSSNIGYRQFWDIAAQKSTRPELSIDEIKTIRVLLPKTKEEQQRIADYLDSKCSEIDTLIENLRARVESVKEYKKAIITEAVTKGLDKDAKMKDSGVEWIGEVPEEWKIVRFKHIASIKSNLVQPDKYMKYPQIAPDNIEKDTGRLLSHQTVEESGIISGNHLFYRGQILYSKIRPNLNKLTVAPFDGLCSADMYPIESKLPTIFMVYSMLSTYFVSQVSLIIRDRVKMPKINQEELGEIEVVVPSQQEMLTIANYLDSKCSEIDALLQNYDEQITVLEEYKKSMIYEYVTGKKILTSDHI